MRDFASQPVCYSHWGKTLTRSDAERIASRILATLYGRTNILSKSKVKGKWENGVESS